MSIDELAPFEAKPAKRTEEKFPIVWPAAVMAITYWAFDFIAARIELDLGTLFFSRLIAIGIGLILATIWWWTNFRIPLRDRAIVAAVFVLGVVVTPILGDKSLGGFGMYLFGIPIVLTAGAVALVSARRLSHGGRRTVLLTALVTAFVFFTVIRVDGLRGNADTQFAWRWSPTAEDRFLAELKKRANVAQDDSATTAEPLVAREGDWLEFRGPNREGVAQVGDVLLDWRDVKPRELWRTKVGPAWSSIIVVADRLFTQEQRGEEEVVSCYDALTGGELWTHSEKSRYWDAVADAGPRGTPTFADGRIYASGAKGILVCLDAQSGGKLWSKETLEDSEGEVPMWGLASSPLVTNGLAIVFSGGTKGKSLLAYDIEDGTLKWSADGGKMSYSSPQLSEIGGQSAVLFNCDRGIVAFDPESGKELWKTQEKKVEEAHSLQPHVVAAGDRASILQVSSEGTLQNLVNGEGDEPKFSSGWLSKDLKPDFNDFVIFDGHAYGFDREIFACISLADGKRKWKKGRYGHGQVILLKDVARLIVLSESGEAVLLAANPKQHEELGRFQAIEGKTWNHPVVVGRKLFVRNGQEMACFDLASEQVSGSGSEARSSEDPAK